MTLPFNKVTASSADGAIAVSNPPSSKDLGPIQDLAIVGRKSAMPKSASTRLAHRSNIRRIKAVAPALLVCHSRERDRRSNQGLGVAAINSNAEHCEVTERPAILPKQWL